MSDNKFTCSLCSAVWKKSGSTNCWSADPSKGPARPAYCPTHGHNDLIKEAFDLYREDSEDARIAKVATRV